MSDPFMNLKINQNDSLAKACAAYIRNTLKPSASFDLDNIWLKVNDNYGVVVATLRLNIGSEIQTSMTISIALKKLGNFGVNHYLSDEQEISEAQKSSFKELLNNG